MSAGQVAVVTGAGRGIGRATTLLAAKRGFVVIGIDRDYDAVRETASLADAVVPLHGDVRDPMTSLHARRTAEAQGSLAAWVNNAAIVGIGPLHKASDSDIEEILAVNVTGMVYGCREAVRSFMAHGVGGSIVNLSSIHARAAFPGYAIYDASKGAVDALTRSVCVDYGHLGIRCNAVAPGAVDTTIVAPDRDQEPEEGRRQTMGLSPMNRISAPEEIAELVLFLMSDVAPGVNGHVLAADNGMSAQGHGLRSEVGNDDRALS